MGHMHSKCESIQKRQWMAEKWGYYVDFDEEGRTVALDTRRPANPNIEWDPNRPLEPLNGIATARAAGLLPSGPDPAPTPPRPCGPKIASGLTKQPTISPAKATDAHLLLVFSQGSSDIQPDDHSDDLAVTQVVASPVQSPRRPLAEISANSGSPETIALGSKGEVVPDTPPRVLRRSVRGGGPARPAATVISSVPAPSEQAARRVAALTRANTRLNKANATVARVTLARLRSGIVKSPLPERVWGPGKTVSWDEQLTYYREAEAEPVEGGSREQKPCKAKATNGAATSRKRKAAAEAPVADAEESAPKRRATRAPAKSLKRKAGADRVEDGELSEPKRRVTRSSNRLEEAPAGNTSLPEPALKSKSRATKGRGRKAAKN